MTSLKKLFIFSISFLIVSILIIIILFLLNILAGEHIKSIMLAGTITTLNAGFGAVSIRSGINKPEKVFLQRLLGGMVIRFLSTLIMVVLALLFLELNRISFIFSILFFYIFYLIIYDKIDLSYSLYFN